MRLILASGSSAAEAVKVETAKAAVTQAIPILTITTPLQRRRDQNDLPPLAEPNIAFLVPPTRSGAYRFSHSGNGSLVGINKVGATYERLASQELR